MKLTIKNHNNDFMKNNLRYGAHSEQQRLKDKYAAFEVRKENNEATSKYNKLRPAQALSFGGSLNSAVVNTAQDVAKNAAPKIKTNFGNKLFSSFTQSGIINRFIAFTADNEAAFTAIYSMIFAGIIKPICVLKQKGSDEKDKQYIATKNFLQAFLGSFLSLTVGGGIMKKVTDTITNNFKIMKVGEKNNIELVDKNAKEVTSVAQKMLSKQYSSLGSKIKLASETTSDLYGTDKIAQFFKDVRKNVSVDYDNNTIVRTFKENGQEITETIKSHDIAQELSQKGKTIYRTAKGHLKIYNKHPEYVAKLLEAMKDTESKTTLYDSFESVLKNSTGWITAIAKAKIASIMLPTVVAFLFADGALRGTKKAKENAVKKANVNNLSMLFASKTFNKENDNYKALLNKNDEKSNNKSQNISFKGNIAQTVGNIFTKGVEHICLSKPAEKFTKSLIDIRPPLNKPSARMGDIESALITTYWVVNTLRSKKIDPSQKLGLNIHTIMVTVVSSCFAFLIDTLFDGAIDKAEYKYSQIIKDAYEKAVQNAQDNPEEFTKIIKEGTSKLFNSSEIEKQITNSLKDTNNADDAIRKLSRNYSKKLSKFKSLVIFTAVVRFIVPVALVPFSGKLKKIVEERKAKKEQKNKTKVN